MYEKNRRREQTKKILKKCKAHVICLQEVDDYKIYWANMFGKLGGYKSKYDQRKKKKEGLCLLYNADHVCLLDMVRLELDDVADCFTEPDISKSYFQRSNIAQIAHFSCHDSNKTFVVVNVHLFWNPVATDVKLFQMWFLCRNVRKYMDQWKTENLIFCGDLNSTPRSAVIALMKEKMVPENHKEYVKFIAQKYPGVLEQYGGLKLDLNLSLSSKDEVFTNYTNGFKSKIDYIFHSGSLELVDSCAFGCEEGLYAYDKDEDYDYLVDEMEMAMEWKTKYPHQYPLLPSYDWPSDHLAIGASFKL